MILLRFGPDGCRWLGGQSRLATTPRGGWFFHGYGESGGDIHSAADLAAAIHRAPGAADFEAALAFPEGGVLTQGRWTPAGLDILTDHIGAFPLYRARGGRDLVIGDDAWAVAREAGLAAMDYESCMDLLAFEMALGVRTLVAGLDELPAGRRIRWTLDGDCFEPREQTIWHVRRTSDLAGDEEARLDAAAQNLRAVCVPIVGHIQKLDGRLALNLSGGWDSRALLAMFSPLGPERLYTCTYGATNFNGTRFARSISSLIGIPNRFFPLDGGEILREPFETLCRWLPPVTRFNLADGGYGLSHNFYHNATAATCGHSGDVWTGGLRNAAVQDPDQFAAWIESAFRAGMSRDTLLGLLRPERRALADAVEEHVAESARGAYAPGCAGTMRWKAEQRVRRLVCPEIRVLERARPLVLTPMLDRRFVDFWGRVPEDDLAGQRLYRRMLARRVFVGPLRPLAEAGREGGGTLEEHNTPAGRLRAKTRRVFFGVARRVAPAWAFERTVNDPNVAWWHRDPDLRKWAWNLIERSDVLKELFSPAALQEFVQRRSLRDFRVARSAIWTLLTLAGVEQTLREGPRSEN